MVTYVGIFNVLDFSFLQDEWVVCRVFHKNTGIKRSSIPGMSRMSSFGEDLLDCSTLPPLIDPPYNSNPGKNDSCFTGGEDIDELELKGNHNNHRPYFSAAALNGHQPQKQQDQKSFLISPNNIHNATNYHAAISNHAPNSIFYPPNHLFPFQPSPSTHGYSQWQMGNSVQSFPGSGFMRGGNQLQGQCKVEQFSSNQSIVSLSQDTGLSTDMNTEISSVLSKHHDIGNNGSYEDPEAPPSVGQMGDLDYLLNY